MLDKQFFGDEKFHGYLNENFITIHAVRGQKSGDQLYKQFTVRGTPTVLIAMADGTEIDRLMGYGPPAEKFKDKIEETYKSENSLLNLTKALENDPNNLALIAKLAQKYQTRYDLGKAYDFTEKLLENPEKAKNVMISIKEDQEVSTYEFGKFVSTYRGWDEVVEFIDEFPSSSLKESAFSNLSRQLNAKNVSDELLKVYDDLLKKYPKNSALITPYVDYCARTNKNIDLGLKLAEQIYDENFEKNNAYALGNHAKLHLLKGNVKKAEQVYGEKFLEHMENDPNISDDNLASRLNSYAWFWALEGQNLESAFKAAKKSIDLSDQANTWDTLSMVYWKMGKHKDAIKAEEKALEMVDGENDNYKKRIEEIKADLKGISANSK